MPPENESAYESPRKASLGSAELLLLCTAALVLLGGCCGPADLVSVSIESPPQPFQFLFVVVETKDGIRGMHWYGYKSHWGPMHLDTSWTNALRDFASPGRHKLDDPIQWIEGDRYGVVIRLPDLTWRVWWFEFAEVNREDISAICGGGKVNFDLRPPRSAEAVTAETVELWGVKSISLDEYIEPRIKSEREWREKHPR